MTKMSRRISRVFDHFRKDHGSKEDADRSKSVASSSTATSPNASRTATFSTTATTSTTATSVQQSGSAHSSRRTSEELNEKPQVIISDHPLSKLIRETTGLQTNSGDALADAKLLAEAGVSLCSLAGYSRGKSMRLLQAMPEYGRTGSRIPSTLNVEGLYRGIQQRRTESYLTYVDFDGVDPMTHRLNADKVMFKMFGDRPEEYADDALKQELENWRYTWHDEITILEQHEEYGRAAEIRKALEPYNYDLDSAIQCVRDARDRLLRESQNLERFNQEAKDRRAEIADNVARRESVRSSASNKSGKSNVTEKSLGRSPKVAAA